MRFSARFFGAHESPVIILEEDNFVHFPKVDKELGSKYAIRPDLINGCDFVVITYRDKYSKDEMFLCAHMSGRYAELYSELETIKLIADPKSIQLYVAHSKQTGESRLHLIAERLQLKPEQCHDYSRLSSEASFDVRKFELNLPPTFDAQNKQNISTSG
jgi:hypothetical protein